MEGWAKVMEAMETYTDWFFMHDFLLPETIEKLGIYIYKQETQPQTIDYVITKDEAEEIRRKILGAFSQQRVPDIRVVNGNYEEKGWLKLEHNWTGINLEETYAKKTLEHIAYLWGRNVVLSSCEDEEKTKVSWSVEPPKEEEEKEEEKPAVQA